MFRCDGSYSATLPSHVAAEPCLAPHRERVQEQAARAGGGTPSDDTGREDEARCAEAARQPERTRDAQVAACPIVHRRLYLLVAGAVLLAGTQVVGLGCHRREPAAPPPVMPPASRARRVQSLECEAETYDEARPPTKSLDDILSESAVPGTHVVFLAYLDIRLLRSPTDSDSPSSIGVRNLDAIRPLRGVHNTCPRVVVVEGTIWRADGGTKVEVVRIRVVSSEQLRSWGIVDAADAFRVIEK